MYAPCMLQRKCPLYVSVDVVPLYVSVYVSRIYVRVCISQVHAHARV